MVHIVWFYVTILVVAVVSHYGITRFGISHEDFARALQPDKDEEEE